MKTPLLQVGQAASPSAPLYPTFRSPPPMLWQHLGKNTCWLHTEAWHLLPAPAGEAAPGSPLRVLSPAVPVVSSPALGAGHTRPAGCRVAPVQLPTARVAAWAVPRGCCADDGFVSAYWSASRTQSPPQCISPFPLPH